jgi:hypothetical protein
VRHCAVPPAPYRTGANAIRCFHWRSWNDRGSASQPTKGQPPMAPRKIENWMTSKAPTLPPNGRSMRVEFSVLCANAGAAATSAAKETFALRMTRLRGLKPNESEPFRCLPALNADLLRKLPDEPTTGIFPLSPPPAAPPKSEAAIFQNTATAISVPTLPHRHNTKSPDQQSQTCFEDE